jgi:hypothetical protein
MYTLIIAIHAVFIAFSHFLGYRVLEGIFFLLWIFFLFYFSPLFFLDTEEKKNKKWGRSPQDLLKILSPKNSLILPVILLYIAIYGFLFSLFSTQGNTLLYHSIIVSVIYILFFAYSMVFYWKNDVFFELLRFHTLFTLIGAIIFTISLLLQSTISSFLHPLTAILGVISWTFLLSYTRQESVIFLWSYLTGIFATLVLGALWIVPEVRIIELCALGIFLTLIIFEYFPKFTIFTPYTTDFRYFSLLSTLLILLPVAYIAFTSVDSTAVFILSITTIFFLTIHRRFTNYVVYMVGILEIFLIYSLLFSGLLINPDKTSVFLFLFFLPLLIIGSTYFWDEAHTYDFALLHYSSIAYSVFYSLYALFFIWWGDDILFALSMCVFGIALLFFLSYFRFPRNKRQEILH